MNVSFNSVTEKEVIVQILKLGSYHRLSFSACYLSDGVLMSVKLHCNTQTVTRKQYDDNVVSINKIRAFETETF